jgi:hypothetical protein
LQFDNGHENPPKIQELSHDTPVSKYESSHYRIFRIEVNFSIQPGNCHMKKLQRL